MIDYRDWLYEHVLHIPATQTPIFSTGRTLLKWFNAVYYTVVSERKDYKDYPGLKEQRKELLKYWKKYAPLEAFDYQYQMWHSLDGKLDPRKLTDRLYFTKIDPYFNDPILAAGIDNKNYYDLLFPDVKQPRTLLRRINGVLCDENYDLMTKEEAVKRLVKEGSAFGKEAVDSFAGSGITIWHGKEKDGSVIDFLRRLPKNVIVQSVLKQHPDLDAIYSGSVATLRIFTFVYHGQVYCLGSLLRLAANGTEFSNSEKDGIHNIYLPIKNEEGDYADVGYDQEYEPVAVHPSGYVFKGGRYPSYKETVELVKKLAVRMSTYQLIGWDMTVDEEGDPVFIEMNCSGSYADIQVQQPLFGDLTDEVLDEIFHKTKKR